MTGTPRYLDKKWRLQMSCNTDDGQPRHLNYVDTVCRVVKIIMTSWDDEWWRRLRRRVVTLIETMLMTHLVASRKDERQNVHIQTSSAWTRKDEQSNISNVSLIAQYSRHGQDVLRRLELSRRINKTSWATFEWLVWRFSSHVSLANAYTHTPTLSTIPLYPPRSHSLTRPS